MIPNSNFNKIIDFIKYVNNSNIDIQTYNYSQNRETVLFLIEQFNDLCYDIKYSHNAIGIYNILLYFLNKDINDATFDFYFEKLHNSELQMLLT